MNQIDRFSGLWGILLAWVSLSIFSLTGDLPTEASNRGRIFSLLTGLSAAGMLHFLRQYFDRQILPGNHSQVAFHFCWISASSGLVAWFSPPLGIQISIVGCLVALLGFTIYPVRQLMHRQLQGFATLLSASGMILSFTYQFFYAEVNQWKTVIWRFPAEFLLFSFIMAGIYLRFPSKSAAIRL